MATIAAQATGIKSALAAVTSIRAESEEPQDVNPSQGKVVAFPILREIAYDEAFDGGTAYTWDVVLIAAPEAVGRARGQQAIDPYLAKDGASSIPAALYAARTLSGTVDDIKVVRAYDRGLIEVGGKAYWGAKVEVLSWD